jgi:hypothetical protein
VWRWLDVGGFQSIQSFATAVPGQEPVLPLVVYLVSHTLPFTAHSALVTGLATLLVWRFKPVFLIPLPGGWSHIVIDVFSHSADSYPSPVLYPIFQRGFDGIAWNTPWFMVANDLALAGLGLSMLRSRKSRSDPGPHGAWLMARMLSSRS